MFSNGSNSTSISYRRDHDAFFVNDIDWKDFSVATPAFFASIFMGFAYSISNGIAAGFIVYGIIKLATGKAKEVHPILWVSMALFILNYVVIALIPTF